METNEFEVEALLDGLDLRRLDEQSPTIQVGDHELGIWGQLIVLPKKDLFDSFVTGASHTRQRRWLVEDGEQHTR